MDSSTHTSARRRMTIRALAGFAAAVLMLAALPVRAQDTQSEAPYERQLLRLSEILGALHFLRPLCGRDDAPSWRERMEDLLAAEMQGEVRKRRHIERFNLGYRGFSSVYQSCTPAARAAMNAYVQEGEKLSRDVAARYAR
ncbi:MULTISPECIES: TIGR02301 family protein [unclassified Pannonibacter]|uniref:TIGR02301 family protein n=1 Tax=unclassified Pannonibacter TaxID=2627228 RepID=UPI001FCA66FD|nr:MULTISPECIES: TIGR02301 family protein [unclassified Pannonibacter]